MGRTDTAARGLDGTFVEKQEDLKDCDSSTRPSHRQDKGFELS